MAGIGIGVMGTVMVGVADIAVDTTTVGAGAIAVGTLIAIAIGAVVTVYAIGTPIVLGVTTKAS